MKPAIIKKINEKSRLKITFFTSHVILVFYYVNCSGIASGSKSRKMVSHMCG